MAMPSLSAASIIVVPWSTSSSTPSICICNMIYSASRLSINHGLAMLDVIFKLWPEVFDKAQYRHRRSIPQRANGTAGNIVADISQQSQIFHLALPFNNALDHAIEPAGAFTARRALTAGFFEAKVRKPL